MRGLIFALGFFVLGGCHKDMTANRSNAELTGETVTVSYLADPVVGHGLFLLENHGAAAITVSVQSAWLEIGGHQQPLAGISVFDLDKEESVNHEEFRVSAGASFRFMLGFPKVAFAPRFGEAVVVGLRVNANGNQLQALSPIRFERRIPLGH